MTTHLTSAELTGALDDEIGADRAMHLETCSACREALASLVATAAVVREAGVVPEPSLFFWERFSNRVRLATANAPMTPDPWWRLQWRPALALGVPLVAIVILASRITWLERPVTGPLDSNVVAIPTVEADDSWHGVELIASELSADEMRRVMAPTPAGAPLIDDLSPRERAAFVELLKVEWETAQ